MIKLIQKGLAISRDGAKAVLRASLVGYLNQMFLLLPTMLFFYFANEVINFIQKGTPITPWYIYVSIGLLVLAIKFGLTHWDYSGLFIATYQESERTRIRLAEKLKELPLSYFSKRDIADLSQSVMQDTNDIENAISHVIPQLIALLMFTLTVGIAMFIHDYRMGFAVLGVLPIALLLLFLSRRFQQKGARDYFLFKRREANAIQEAFELHAELESYGQTESCEKHLHDLFLQGEKEHLRSELKQAIPVNLTAIVLKFGMGITLLVSTYLYARGDMSLLQIIVYLVMASKIYDPLSGMVMFFAQLIFIDARVKRLNEIFEYPLSDGAQGLTPDGFDIVLDGVGFSYEEGVKVIDNVSFTASQNEVTALVGPSGCGKTTIVRLISRLYDHDVGSIRLGGLDVKEMAVDDLFSSISVVFQEVILFNNSVLENIRIGKKDATDEEVYRAARMANCDEFVRDLPEGYRTMIGENGSQLSGGQRQRISIARALLKDAPVLLLDEISASVDVENELIIQEALSRLIKGRTVIVIAHRLRTIEKADKIVVMKEGQVESIGQHDELLTNSETYRNMVERSQLASRYTY